ncbi:hypothetical protein SB48_HM08orf03095 [Heyndrickxia coagulans]|uniref:Uncharacterized protein n=1 Tax=Heyndrickxia coagulans TaxID=1398 RepID=A0AAN0T4M5_HEYCO|nr:hypothetical protein SB48_HM08orf03095 [Heyndrickxia coagulans]
MHVSLSTIVNFAILIPPRCSIMAEKKNRQPRHVHEGMPVFLLHFKTLFFLFQ